MKKIITYLFIFSALYALAQKPSDYFKQANAAYKSGAYQQAITLYEKVLESGHEAPEVYFNLGNAYYKLNRIAPSIYFYEKALKLNPSDEDIRYNLQLANRMKLDRIEKVPENILVRLKKNINQFLAYNTWAWLAVFMAFAGLFAFIIFLFTKKPNIKRLTFVAMWVSLFLLLFAWYNADFGYRQSLVKYAIIFSPEVELKTEPNLTADTVSDLHEGSKVKIIQSDGDWYLVQLSDGKKAWLPSSDLKIID